MKNKNTDTMKLTLFQFEKEKKKSVSASNETARNNNLWQRISKKKKKLLLTILAIISIVILDFQASLDGLLFQIIVALTWVLLFILSEKIWEIFLTGRNLNPVEFNNEERYNEYESKGYDAKKCTVLLEADCDDFNKKKDRGTKLSFSMRLCIAILFAFLSVFFIISSK